MTQVLAWWRHSWLLRWTVANIVGWLLALLTAALSMWLLGALGALLAGAIVGGIVGAFQAWALFDTLDRRWLGLSAVGGGLGLLPTLLLIPLSLLHFGLAAFLIGTLFGSILAACQALYLSQQVKESAYAWIPVCGVAAGIATWFSTLMMQLGVPLCLSPGTLIFALLTGWLILRWR